MCAARWDRGAPRALRYRGRARVAQAAHNRFRQRRPARARLRRPPQHAERAARNRPETRRAVIDRDVVTAIAQEGEIAVGQPAQKRQPLLEFAAARRAARGLGYRLFERGAHRHPVVGGVAHVVQYRREPRLEGGGVRRAAPDLDAHHRFGPRRAALAAAGAQIDQPARGVALHPEDRVRNEPDRYVAPAQLRDERIDDERAVIGHDVDRRMRRAPAVGFGIGGRTRAACRRPPRAAA